MWGTRVLRCTWGEAHPVCRQVAIQHIHHSLHVTNIISTIAQPAEQAGCLHPIISLDWAARQPSHAEPQPEGWPFARACLARGPGRLRPRVRQAGHLVQVHRAPALGLGGVVPPRHARQRQQEGAAQEQAQRAHHRARPPGLRDALKGLHSLQALHSDPPLSGAPQPLAAVAPPA